MFKVTKTGGLDLDKRLRDMHALKRYKLAKEMSEISVKHFKQGFSAGGHRTDASKGGWQTLSNGARSHLRKSGRLYRSIRAMVNRNSYTVYTDVPYGAIHNEGKGRMPKREFIGDSYKLNKKLIRLINRTFNKIMK